MLRFRIVLIAPLLSAAVPTAAQNPLRDFFVHGDRAIGMAAARPVAGPGVEQVVWSSDGRYLLCLCSGLREPDAPSSGGYVDNRKREEVWVSLYNARTTKSEVVWSAPKSTWTLEKPQWLSGAATAYFIASNSEKDPLTGARIAAEKRVVEIDATNQDAREIFRLPYRQSEPFIQLICSPRQPRAVLAIVDREADNSPDPLVVYQLGDPYRTRPSIQPKLGLTNPNLCWSADGTTSFVRRLLPPKRTGDAPGSSFLALDFERLTLSEVVNPPLAKNEPAPGIQLLSRRVGGVTELWLASDDKSEVPIPVSLDVDQGALAPGAKAIAEICQGVALVRNLVSMPVRDYYLLREPVERAVCEKQARLCYLVLRKYAAEHEQSYPQPSDYLNALLPYAEDPSLLDGFVYRFVGGMVANTPKGKSTVLAVIQGVTGRAYLLADGTVNWESSGLTG